MDLVVSNQHYRTQGKLNALQQLHVGRRVAPVLASMGISLATLRAGAQITREDMAFSLGPISEVVAHMADETVEYIVGTCLSVVQREQIVNNKPAWAPVAVGPVPVFGDIDMPIMLRLVVGVLMENIGNFLTELDAEMQPSANS